ncbi:MAG: hypothetical protein ACR2J8_14735, partial [Thermomicrobiales bacterium]
MDGTRFDRWTRGFSRRRGLVAAGAVLAGTRRSCASAQIGQVMPGGACWEHRECAMRMDAPATFCLPRVSAMVCCSIQSGICATDAECCGMGVCIAGLCVGGPVFDMWIAVRAISLLAAPDKASPVIRVIPVGSRVRVISSAPSGGYLTATWEGAYG